MNKRVAFWVAWSSWVLYLVIAVVTVFFQVREEPSDMLTNMFDALVLLALATIGALVVARRPENPIGWIFCVGTLLSALGNLSLEYATYTLIIVSGSSPAGELAAVFGGIARSIGWFLLLTFLLLLFPDGHLPSPRWRSLARLIVGLLVADTLVILFAPISSWSLELASVRNPLEIVAVGGLLDQLTGLIPIVLFATSIACIVSVALRFRRARGEERQQLKWLAYGMALSVLVLVVIAVLMFTNAMGAPGVLFYLAVVCIPISSGIAILRYRLYDIDVLINRTLVYGLLTATLLGIYFLLIFGGQYLLASFFGPGNDAVLVVSTLVVAALFQPLRRQVQELVDRRFYRSKYDAGQVVARFSETLYQEVDMNQLCAHLLGVVQETMQPAHLSLWLCPHELHKEQEGVRVEESSALMPWRTKKADTALDSPSDTVSLIRVSTQICLIVLRSLRSCLLLIHEGDKQDRELIES